MKNKKTIISKVAITTSSFMTKDMAIIDNKYSPKGLPFINDNIIVNDENFEPQHIEFLGHDLRNK